MQPELTPDESAASLAFATNLSDGMLESQNPNPQMETEEVEEKEESLGKEDVQKMIEEQLSTFKEDLMNALNEEEGKDTAS